MKGRSISGKDLIVYILTNNLENEILIQDGQIDLRAFGLMTGTQLAERLGVGRSTIEAYVKMGRITGVAIDGTLYFPLDTKDPRKD